MTTVDNVSPTGGTLINEPKACVNCNCAIIYGVLWIGENVWGICTDCLRSGDMLNNLQKDAKRALLEELEAEEAIMSEQANG